MYGEGFEKKLVWLDSRYPEGRKRAALLAALHAVQDIEGFVPEAAVHWLAARYGVSAADIKGVISFYTMLFDSKPGKHVIWLCKTFPCEIMGASRVMKALEERLGCKVGGPDPTGTFELRWQECLAACDKAPCALIDDDMYEHLTPAAVDIVLEHVRAGGGGGAIRSTASGGPELVASQVTGGR